MALTNLDELVANIGIEQVDSTSGAGAVSDTFGAPKTYRRTQDRVIITQIKFSLEGLECEGGSADDVIGLESGQPDAYIGRYVVADCGVVFKTTLACVESPGQGVATITSNINITSNASSSLGYNDAAGAVQPITGGTLIINESVENLLNTMAANDYLYITEEDTAGATGTYDAGQYIFTMYGHAALS